MVLSFENEEIGVTSNANAFCRELTEPQKKELKEKLEKQFCNILETLGIDVKNDQHTKETPKRLAKMYVDEVMVGRYTREPNITAFEATHQDMVIVKDIDVRSMCSHHFVPIIGKAHVGYIPDKKVIGLSKFARIIEYFSRRPQIQEELTKQVFDYLYTLLQPKSLYIMIEAEHYCMIWRGVKNNESKTITSYCCDEVKNNLNLKSEYLNLVKG